MNTMILAGTICWVFEFIMLAWYLYEGRDDTTKRAYILKGGVSLNTIVYAMTLILLFSHFTGNALSRNALLFVVGMFFAFLGDMGLATMQRRHGGSSKAIFKKISSEEVNIQSLTAGVVGALFIISFFFQMVAFLRGIHGDVQQFLLPFLVCFLLPPIFTLVGGMAAQYKIPEVSTNIFIIAVFFVLLTSAFFSSAVVYAFWMYHQDAEHASFVFSAAVLFVLSVLMLAMRYTMPDKFDRRAVRGLSRLLNYLSRMMFAGCAFLF